MVDIARRSALAEHIHGSSVGQVDAPVYLTEVADLHIQQVAAWPDSLTTVADQVAAAVGCRRAPAPGLADTGQQGAALRIEPLKWWLLGCEMSELDAEQGAVLDLSHSRTHIRISGSEAATLLNRHLPLDLRERNFPVGSVASTAFHHVGVTLWRSEQGYELFLPRGFAVSLWELLVDSARSLEG